MPLSWNEIRHRAIQFSHRWTGTQRESAEKQTFWNEFFEVFGVSRRAVASFEEPVKKLSGHFGAIDLFWKSILLVEHKSLGENLGKAESQAFEYIQSLAREGRHDEIPRYVIVSDFARIALHDLEPEDRAADVASAGPRSGRGKADRRKASVDEGSVATHQFSLDDFHRCIHAFAFIPGYKQHKFEDQDPINLKAVGILGDLHDALEAGGYEGYELERFLVRVLFCLFADHAGIFDRESFHLYVENRTAADGSDLGAQLNRLFEVLNTPAADRQTNLEETLAGFPYVNGDLFAERLGFADFNRDMRNSLLACTRFDWSRISPAVFGALFQSVMEPRERRQIGGHYTSERDILKVIRSLFLDDLKAEFEGIRTDRSTRRRARLEEFQQRLASLRFLDPACGCGNFLVITYRELRLLEIEVLKLLHGRQRALTLDDVNKLAQVDVDQFFGIEIGEWPARIAEVALWLMDHQMNLQLSEAFGQHYVRLPLCKAPHIRVGNALRIDWNSVLPSEECNYVLGNPPFVGKKEQTKAQKDDIDVVWNKSAGTGILDYVTGWYRVAAEYIQESQVRVAFVSTNSITQGEQVGVLWSELFRRFLIKIHFAHTTFAWESEARGKAHVHVVIVGFGAFDWPRKTLFEYETPKSDGHAVPAKNINPYLADAPDVVVTSRKRPINGAPVISYGSMMIDKDRKDGDDAGLLLSSEHRAALLAECPALRPFIRRLCGGEEFLNGMERWCLWLVDAPSQLPRQSPLLRKRLDGVRKFREKSGREQTRKLATTPTLFGEIRQPDTPYLLIPKVSSEQRRYIPIGLLQPEIIASGSALIVPGATLYHFGVLSSAMHNAWMRRVAGRLESRFQYSGGIVYNNFPWPTDVSDEQREHIANFGERILHLRVQSGDGRSGFLPSRKSTTGAATLADLYDPLSMPRDLVLAHRALDRAVDRCYRKKRFASDRERVEFLFNLYEQLTAPLLPKTEARGARSG